MASKREGLHTSHFIYRWSMMKVLIRFTYHRHAWWRQRSKLQIMSSVWRMFGDNSTTKNHRNTKIGGKVVHATPDIPHKFQGQKVKGQGHQAALVRCTGMPTWTYSNVDLSICVHDVYHVTTCSPGQRHIVAATHLQPVYLCVIAMQLCCPAYLWELMT